MKIWCWVLCGLASTYAVATDEDAVVGIWVTEGQQSHVEIYKENDRYFGKIVHLSEPRYEADDPMAGQEKVDRENPEESLRDRPILGLLLMEGFRFNGSKWVDGTIYDPENGKTYKCKLTLRDPATLEVRGYIGFSLLGRTTVWHRKP